MSAYNANSLSVLVSLLGLRIHFFGPIEALARRQRSLNFWPIEHLSETKTIISLHFSPAVSSAPASLAALKRLNRTIESALLPLRRLDLELWILTACSKLRSKRIGLLKICFK